jgi:ABC-2 type transport system ATP-binding protein
MKRLVATLSSLALLLIVLLETRPHAVAANVSGDEQCRNRVLNEVRRTEKTTIFLTTHYLDEAEDVDHLAIVNHGKIVMAGTPQKVKSQLIDEYILTDAKDREHLLKELTAKDIPFVVSEHIKIDISKKKVQEIMKSIDTELSFVQIHTPTLEDAYLEIIGNKE